MKIQNNKDDFYSWDKDDKSQEHEFSSSRKRFLLIINQWIIIGKILHMSPIVSITAMETKKSRWFNAWTTPISEILDGSKNNVESTI